MEIDIRAEGSEKVEYIRFADADGSILADVIRRYDADNPVWLCNSESEFSEILGIKNRNHAENVIKAIKEAKERGWFE